MAAPTYVAAGGMDASVTSGAVLDPALPVGWAADDIHVMPVTWVGSVLPNTPSGFTEWTALQYRNGTVFNANVYWRRAVGGDGIPNISMASATTNLRSCNVYGFRGCDTSGDPLDQASVSANAASATVSTASITTVATETIVAFLYAYEDDPLAATQPSGYSAFDISTSSTASDTAHGGAWKQLTSPGTENPSTTVSGGTFTNSPNVGWLIALRAPAAAPSGIFPQRGFYPSRFHRQGR